MDREKKTYKMDWNPPLLDFWYVDWQQWKTQPLVVIWISDSASYWKAQ